MLAATSPIFKLLNEKIEEVTRTPEEERVFDARMKMRSDILGEMELSYNEGFEKGIETGMATGAYQTRLETAKKCLDMKMPLETILELTGLKRSEIENLTRL